MTKLESLGWIIFLLSGGAFLVSGAIAGDVWVVGGSVLFILGILAVLFGARR